MLLEVMWKTAASRDGGHREMLLLAVFAEVNRIKKTSVKVKPAAFLLVVLVAQNPTKMGQSVELNEFIVEFAAAELEKKVTSVHPAGLVPTKTRNH